jgi:MFS family permease
MRGPSKTTGEDSVTGESVERRWSPRFLSAIGAPALTARQWRVLGVLGAANVVDSYDLALLGLGLPQIQAGLGVAEADVGAVLAFVRLGVIPAVVLTLLADSAGRRRLLLITIAGFTACTGLTAFSRGAADFVLFQFFARAFIAGETMLAIVVITEEFDAANRGWGIGMLGALGALGYGLASLIYATVHFLPFGWRALYFLGVLPLLLVVWFRRTLKETVRFEHQRAGRACGGAAHPFVRPLADLARMYPGRMLAVVAAAMPFAFVAETVMFFPSKFLQEAHGYSPAHVAAMYLTVGVLGLAGNLVAGSLGDRLGRKRILITGLLVNAAAAALFYNLSGWFLPLLWGVMVMSVTMVLVLFSAVGSELFPTSHRSTASGARQTMSTTAAAFGLWCEGALYVQTGSHAGAITTMLAVAPVAPLVVALFLPETAGRELEEISPERERDEQ